jgi:hypothetical protein
MDAVPGIEPRFFSHPAYSLLLAPTEMLRFLANEGECVWNQLGLHYISFTWSPKRRSADSEPYCIVRAERSVSVSLDGDDRRESISVII